MSLDLGPDPREEACLVKRKEEDLLTPGSVTSMAVCYDHLLAGSERVTLRCLPDA